MKMPSITTVLLVISILWIVSIALKFYQYTQSDVEVYVRDDSRAELLADIVSGGLGDPDTRFFADMAELSSLAYQEDQPTRHRRWTRLETEPLFKKNTFFDLVRFSVWRNDVDKLLVVVFRGTDSIFDFHANLHWITKWLPFYLDQYEQIPEVLKIVEPLIPNGFTGVSAGHSLGGGLAQHALYRSDLISLSYVFNSTSVTGWNDIDIENRADDPRVKDTKIYRIHENGEVLEFLRLLAKAGYLLSPEPNKHPYVKEYRLNTQSKGLFSQHSIDKLSKSLRDKQNQANKKM